MCVLSLSWEALIEAKNVLDFILFLLDVLKLSISSISFIIHILMDLQKWREMGGLRKHNVICSPVSDLVQLQTKTAKVLVASENVD